MQAENPCFDEVMIINKIDYFCNFIDSHFFWTLWLTVHSNDIHDQISKLIIKVKGRHFNIKFTKRENLNAWYL